MGNGTLVDLPDAEALSSEDGRNVDLLVKAGRCGRRR
jgi:hypothetical protein